MRGKGTTILTALRRFTTRPVSREENGTEYQVGALHPRDPGAVHNVVSGRYTYEGGAPW